MLVDIVPDAGGQRLCFSADRQRAGTTTHTEGATHDSKSASSDCGSDYTCNWLAASYTSLSRAAGTARAHVATYIGLDGRVRDVGVVGEVCRRGQRAQRALAGRSHGSGGLLWWCLREFADASSSGGSVEESGGIQLDGIGTTFPVPGFWRTAHPGKTNPSLTALLANLGPAPQQLCPPPICHLATRPTQHRRPPNHCCHRTPPLCAHQ